jgi:drug/metabolite transporter (DMT)-like permease
LNWNVIGNGAFYVATASTVIFAILYLFLAPWWKTPAGRNIMAVMGAMGLAFGYFAWAIAIGGTPPAFVPMRAIIFIAIAASVTWRTVIFIKHHVIRSLFGREGADRDDHLQDSR